MIAKEIIEAWPNGSTVQRKFGNGWRGIAIGTGVTDTDYYPKDFKIKLNG